MTLTTTFGCFWTDLKHCFLDSVVDFEQVNAGWRYSCQYLKLIDILVPQMWKIIDCDCNRIPYFLYLIRVVGLKGADVKRAQILEIWTKRGRYFSKLCFCKKPTSFCFILVKD